MGLAGAMRIFIVAIFVLSSFASVALADTIDQQQTTGGSPYYFYYGGHNYAKQEFFPTMASISQVDLKTGYDSVSIDPCYGSAEKFDIEIRDSGESAVAYDYNVPICGIMINGWESYPLTQTKDLVPGNKYTIYLHYSGSALQSLKYFYWDRSSSSMINGNSITPDGTSPADFTFKTYSPSTCTHEYVCEGLSRYEIMSNCKKYFVETCSGSCVNGVCSAPPAPSLTISAFDLKDPDFKSKTSFSAGDKVILYASVNSLNGVSGSYYATFNVVKGSVNMGTDTQTRTAPRIGEGDAANYTFIIPSDGTYRASVSISNCGSGTCYSSRDFSTTPSCVDNDGDGYGVNCAKGSDCNDSNSAVNPGANEICGNGIDENCDYKDDVCAPVCIDNDGDGYGTSCAKGADCDDSDSMIHPGAQEVICDSKDNDCSALTKDDSCSSGMTCDYASHQCVASCIAGTKCKDSTTLGFQDTQCSWSNLMVSGQNAFCDSTTNAFKCQSGYTKCEADWKDGCTNLLYDDKHCGSCLGYCGSLESCVEGSCVLKEGFCYGDYNCAGSQVCINSTCVTQEKYADLVDENTEYIIIPLEVADKIAARLDTAEKHDNMTDVMIGSVELAKESPGLIDTLLNGTSQYQSALGTYLVMPVEYIIKGPLPAFAAVADDLNGKGIKYIIEVLPNGRKVLHITEVGYETKAADLVEKVNKFDEGWKVFGASIALVEGVKAGWDQGTDLPSKLGRVVVYGYINTLTELVVFKPALAVLDFTTAGASFIVGAVDNESDILPTLKQFNKDIKYFQSTDFLATGLDDLKCGILQNTPFVSAIGCMVDSWNEFWRIINTPILTLSQQSAYSVFQRRYNAAVNAKNIWFNGGDTYVSATLIHTKYGHTGTCMLAPQKLHLDKNETGRAYFTGKVPQRMGISAVSLADNYTVEFTVWEQCNQYYSADDNGCLSSNPCTRRQESLNASFSSVNHAPKITDAVYNKTIVQGQQLFGNFTVYDEDNDDVGMVVSTHPDFWYAGGVSPVGNPSSRTWFFDSTRASPGEYSMNVSVVDPDTSTQYQYNYTVLPKANDQPPISSPVSSGAGGGGSSHYTQSSTPTLVITTPTPVVSEPKPVVLPVGSVIRGGSKKPAPTQTPAPTVVSSAVSTVSAMQQPAPVPDVAVSEVEQKEENQGLTEVTGMLVKKTEKKSWLASAFSSSNYKDLGNGKLGSVASTPTPLSWWDNIINWLKKII